MCTAHPDSVFVANYALCKQLILRMAAECKSRGIRFDLAAVPLVYEDDAVARCRDADSSFDPLFFDRDLGVLAASSGFGFVPMTAEFASRFRGGVALQWQHWNYQGHEAAFRVLRFAGPPAPGPGGKTQAN